MPWGKPPAESRSRVAPARPRCPACDQTAMTVVGHLSQETYLRCESCGLIWVEEKSEAP